MAREAAADAKIRDNRSKLLERAMSRHGYAGNGLIEVLHTAQELFGYLGRDRLVEIATKLKLPPSRVLGVATFYNFFSLKPKAEHTAVVCTGTACHVAGAQDLVGIVDRRCKRLEGQGIKGRLSGEGARCIGSCGLAPAVVLDGRILPRVSTERLERELDALGLEAAAAAPEAATAQAAAR